MNLSRVLDGVPVIKMFQTMYGKMVVTHDVEVRHIQYDSRKVEPGDMFVAMRGGTVDGHTFIGDAIGRGARVVVLDNDAALPDAYFMHAGAVKVVVDDARKALARMAANFFDHPSRSLKVIGVTGTNGKTSTTYLMKSILESHGETVGLIGTIQYLIGGEVVPASHTTPESLELNGLLATMQQRGCTAAVMEVSSHALALHRVHGLSFAAAAFTNLTQDHLDFHGTEESYFQAKKLLFDELGNDALAVTNADDPHGTRIVAGTKARVLSYSLGTPADVQGTDVTLGLGGTAFTVTYKESSHRVESSLIGRFNAQNILAAYSTAAGLGIPHEEIARGIRALQSVRGRFQQIVSPDGWVAVVDYAHTPDALENCLRAIHDIFAAETRGRIITIFGCGGNRDKGKRPAMGRIATQLSDVTIITSDNPRNEDPDEIIGDIRAGCLPAATVRVERDRRKAIRLGLEMAVRGDVVLVAGKGHEEYQIIGEKRMHFDDAEEVHHYIRSKK